MKTSDTIILQLADGKATTSALAEKLRQASPVVAAFCDDLQIDGLINQEELGTPGVGRKLAAWHLTDAGKARAETLKASA